MTGPSRAVVIMNPVTFEVDLKVKGETEAEDKVLSLKIFEYDRPAAYGSNAYVTRNCCSSKRSTLGFKLATLLDTVEATVVSAKVVGGSWLDHFRGRVVCRTASASKEDIVLLDSRDGRMPITADGEIELSRSVVSVELTGQLIFRVVASQMGDKTDVIDQAVAVFTPTIRGKSHGTCELGFCKLEVIVAWSLFSTMEDLRLQNRI